MAPYKVRVTNDFTDGKGGLTVSIVYHLSPGKDREFEIPLPSPNEPPHFMRIRVIPGDKTLRAYRVELPSRGELTFVPETEIPTSMVQSKTGGALIIPGDSPKWELQINPPDLKTETQRGDGEEGPDNISVGENGDGG